MTPVEKRKERDDDDDAEQSSPSTDNKRLKCSDDVDSSSQVHSAIVGANELASAFALASLATMSPTRSHMTSELLYESRDADHGDEAVPISPDVRSPIRSQSKRVTFSNDTKETSQRRTTSRKLTLPSSRPKQHQQPLQQHPGSRMPPDFARMVPPYHPSRNPHLQQQQQQHIIPPPPSTWTNHSRLLAVQQRHNNMAFMAPPPPPPSSLSPPIRSSHTAGSPQQQTTDKWICDFCNIAAFDTYQEACLHEESCRTRCNNSSNNNNMMHHHHHVIPEWQHSMGTPQSMYPPPSNVPITMSSPMAPPVLVHSESRAWYEGVTSLAIPDSDRDWLSGLNCYIREQCVEAFSATLEDVHQTSKRGRISLCQVGIRCRFCSHLPKDEVTPAAVSYPSSITGIYESVKRWQKVHLEVCLYVPQDVKSKLEAFGSSNAWVPTTRQYWADSAKLLGMVDTQNGIRFSMSLKKPMSNNDIEVNNGLNALTSSESMGVLADGAESALRENNDKTLLRDGDNIVQPEDMSMVPPYVYFLMRQVESTHFTEADRFVARSKGPVGYSGFQCRHCQGHAGLGKYFPVSAKSLSTNSTSQNIHSHLLKCRKVPPYVKDQLINLKEEKSKAPRLEPGWRRIFFEKIWSRLHG